MKILLNISHVSIVLNVILITVVVINVRILVYVIIIVVGHLNNI